MKRPAVFFDRDNTLIVNDGYLGDPAQVKLIPGAADAVARARAMGYAVVTFSNQSGVARGMFDEEAVRRVNQRMDRLMILANPLSIIDRHEYCPFHPEAKVAQYRQESPLRKPQPGMIYKAASMMDLDVAGSWVIGDAPRDIEAGKAAGCRTILFHDPTLPKSPAAAEEGDALPDYMVTTLGEAMGVIEREGRKKAAASAPVPPSVADPASSDDGVAEPTEPANTDDAKAMGNGSPNRVEALLGQLVHEVRRQNEREHSDFSVAKLLAGIVQVIVLGVLFMTYLGAVPGGYQNAQAMLLVAILLQVMVGSLLLMGKKR